MANDAEREVARTPQNEAETQAFTEGSSGAASEAATTGLQKGQRISEYVLDELVGRGGFGEVWRAHHHVWTDRLVAVKVPLEGDYVSRLRSEGVLQHRVESPHIVQTIGLDPEHEPPYLIMEWVQGESLRDRMRREKKLPPADALRIARQIAEALTEAHKKGIVHRDLKPENILLNEEGDVRLTDFGLGKLVESAAHELVFSGSLRSKEGAALVGTMRYMAPEQRDPERAGSVDHRADLYAFGIVLFEMLTGGPPEGGEVPSEVVSGLDPRIDAIFRACYCRLDARYADAPAVLRDIDGLAASEPVVEEPKQANSERVQPLAPGPRRPLERLGLRPTGFFARVVAAVIDLLVLFYFILYVGRAFMGTPALVPFLLLGYEILATGLFGRTLGKWLVGAKVVDARGGPVRPGQAIGRALLKIVSALPVFAGYALVAIDTEKRSFHDHVAGTAVVYDR